MSAGDELIKQFGERHGASLYLGDWTPPLEGTMPPPPVANDVDMAMLRTALYRDTELTPDQVMFAMMTALVDVQFARALDAVITAKEPGALKAYISEVWNAIQEHGKPTAAAPRTMRETVRQMQAHAIGHVQKLTQPEAVEAFVKAFLEKSLKTLIGQLLGLKPNTWNDTFEFDSNRKTPIYTMLEERVTSSANKLLPDILAATIDEVETEWQPLAAKLKESIQKRYRMRLDRELEKHVEAEAERRLKLLFERALNDTGSGEGNL